MLANRIGFFVLVGCIACIGCTRTVPVDMQAEADAIRELDRRWNEAVNSKNIEAILGFYASDAVEMPANAPLVVGRDAIRKWFESWVLDPSVSNSFIPEVIDVAASGDLAIDRGTYRFSTDTPDGRVEDVGKYILVWKKIDGQWKAVADISNSDKPLAGQ